MSLLKAFNISKPVRPDEVYPLILDLVKPTKRVKMAISDDKRLTYFECLVAKHHVLREVQVYDD